ncbi:MAG TPA: PilT/PilU family type 4a pilus ATPase [candidate division Zixibacteria bacterium]|nr:PilT/PilU family type 4a pilus ATPase [candidate division Zixibacteria bacterium]
MNLNDFLLSVIKKGASDIHFKVGSPPVVRIFGELIVTKSPPLRPQDTSALAFTFLNESRGRRFASFTEIDTTYSIEERARFRVNIYKSKGHFSIALRYIPMNVPELEKLGIPPKASEMALEPRGLVLVTGVTGSGKSTTLAAMVDHINKNRRRHIITIEDPIEFIHSDIKSVINQREVGVDSPTFMAAMRSAMREDPDVILIGELRDTDAVATAIRAAETGHMVLSTFHTVNTKETINSIISFFPEHEQVQVKAKLAANLRGVISQRLIRKKDNTGRVLASEVMAITQTIRACIVDEEKREDIPYYISQGASEYGMQTFDQAVMKLYKADLISYEDALANASSPAEFERALQFG